MRSSPNVSVAAQSLQPQTTSVSPFPGSSEHETWSAAKSGNLPPHQSAMAKVNDPAPRLTGINGNGMTFYPLAGSDIDTFAPRVTVNESGRLWFHIFNGAGTMIRSIGVAHAWTGTFRFVWNGRTTQNAVVAQGWYGYRFIAKNLAGRLTTSADYRVYVSHKKLVAKTVSYTEHGDEGRFVGSSSCSSTSVTPSWFVDGVSLESYGCTIYADYSFAVPSAYRYKSIPSSVLWRDAGCHAFQRGRAQIYDFATGTWNIIGGIQHAPYGQIAAPAWSTYGTVSTAGLGFISGRHIAAVGILVPNGIEVGEYDIGSVAITVSYLTGLRPGPTSRVRGPVG